MKEKTHMFMAAILVLLVLACFSLVYKTSSRDYIITQTGAEGIPKISAQGTTQLEIMPDEVEIRIALETKAKKAKDAQDQNSELMENIQAALKQAGLRSDDIESVNYNLRPETAWDQVTQKSKTTGYRVYHTIKITVDDIDKAGTFVQVAIDAGANRIENINFKLSKKLEKQVKEEALKQAAISAKEKALAIADGLGVRIGDVLSVSESNFGWSPVYRTTSMQGLGMDEIAQSAPPIEPGLVNVNAQISVSYKII